VLALRRINVRGSVVLGVFILTLCATLFVRQNISDLRSYSEFQNMKKITDINSLGQKKSFDVGDICEPLETTQRALIVNISGFLEVSDDDVEILSLTNSLNGIQLVINEARQPIIYLTNPNLAPNVKGYELLPPAFDLYEGKQVGPESLGKLDFTFRLFQIVSSSTTKLVIQSETRTPKEFSQSIVVPSLTVEAPLCGSRGILGYEGPQTNFNATFSSADIDRINIGVLRNLRAHVVVLALTVFSTVLAVGWLKQKRLLK
jgi:hypothetical protein